MVDSLRTIELAFSHSGPSLPCKPCRHGNDLLYQIFHRGAGRHRPHEVAVIDTGVDRTHFRISSIVAALRQTLPPADSSLQFQPGTGCDRKSFPGMFMAGRSWTRHACSRDPAAATQNTAGVAGLGYPLQVIAYKVLDSSGSGSDANGGNAIMAAADAAPALISLSLGGAGYSLDASNRQ